jgi:hypothetical protein
VCHIMTQSHDDDGGDDSIARVVHLTRVQADWLDAAGGVPSDRVPLPEIAAQRLRPGCSPVTALGWSAAALPTLVALA